MNLSYNISFTIASLIICVILLFVISLQYSTTNVVNKRYKFFLISTIVLFVLDIVTVITNDNNIIPVELNIVLNSLYFFTGACVAVLFLYYCVGVALADKSKRTRKIIKIINLSILGVYGVSLIINGFLGYYFYFDGGVYTHGDAYLFVNALTLVFVLEALVIFLVKHKKFNIRQIVATASFHACFFTAFLLQLFVFPNVLLSDFGCALGALLVFFSIETPDYVNLMKTLKELNDLKASLENQVEDRTKELASEKKSYEELTLETLSSLAAMVDAKDHYTNGHSFRVAAYAKGMAKMLGFSSRDAEQLYFAGLIHDVGKIGISERILTKPGKLTKEEFDIIKSHSSIGGEILKGIKQFPVFEKVAKSHHERYDGEGYPNGLKGEDIPFEGRIVAICDSFDAMTSDRCYRKALSDITALSELQNGKGTQFDPELVEVFFKLYNSYPDSIRNHIDELKE